MIDAFEDQIGSAVENAIIKKLKEGILKLDSFLQALPKEITVDDNASLNVTFVKDPSLSNSSIGFEINGLFTERKRDLVPMYQSANTQPSVFCPDSSKMLGIALDEAVFNSASSLYYNVSL
jgi:lipopolysaccharide-binding protein